MQQNIQLVFSKALAWFKLDHDILTVALYPNHRKDELVLVNLPSLLTGTD